MFDEALGLNTNVNSFLHQIYLGQNISAVIAKANRCLGVLKKNKYILSRQSLEIGYFSFI